jgi:CheY-like chemotaxis protein
MEYDGRGMLVVDDDRAICELLEILLSEEGYEVACATTIARALDLAATHQVDLILFDMSLADGDGEHFVERYRRLPQASARLIAVSGIANLEQEATRIGADGFLTKPFEIDDLLSTVSRAMVENAPA